MFVTPLGFIFDEWRSCPYQFSSYEYDVSYWSPSTLRL